MVLDPQTLDLAPRAAELLAASPHRDGLKLELPASQLESVRAPRQGARPVYDSGPALAHDLAWGNRAGRLQRLAGWWWELRLHAELGTIEVRVPDAQSTVGDAGALIATTCALVLWLAERHDAGEL